jgi:hypothetical protein
LDGLNEDLNHIVEKKYIEKEDKEYKNDFDAAKDAWLF